MVKIGEVVAEVFRDKEIGQMLLGQMLVAMFQTIRHTNPSLKVIAKIFHIPLYRTRTNVPWTNIGGTYVPRQCFRQLGTQTHL